MNRALGYEPRFDINYEEGAQAELWVSDVRTALVAGLVEVKRDTRFQETGNLFIEVECRYGGVWKPSGLDVTQSELWAHVVDLPGGSQVAFVVPVALLRELVTPLRANPMGEQRLGSHPTHGVLLPGQLLMAALCGRLIPESAVLR